MFQRGSYGEVMFTELLGCLKSSERTRKCYGWTSVVWMPTWCFYQLGKWIICLDDPVADEISRKSSSNFHGRKRVSSHCHLLGGCTCSIQPSPFCDNCTSWEIKTLKYSCVVSKYWLFAEIWLQIFLAQTERGPLMFVQCSSKEGKLLLGCSSTGSKLTAIKTIRV